MPSMKDALGPIIREAAVSFLQADANGPPTLILFGHCCFGPLSSPWRHRCVLGHPKLVACCDAGDGQLDFDEFLTAVPEKLQIGKKSELREIFDAADTDSSGAITQDEFFFWTLSVATEHGGIHGNLDEIFSKFDTTGDGQLNSREFQAAVEPFGFGTVAHDIFAELDNDGTGTVCYKEVISALKARRVEVSINCKRLLTSMSFEMMRHDKDEIPELDKTPWHAEDPKDIQQVLQTRMAERASKPYGLFRALLQSVRGKRKLKKEQWPRSLRLTLGFQGPDTVAMEAFLQMESDGGKLMSFEAFLTWLNGRKARKKATKGVSLVKRREKGDEPLETIKWTRDILRKELQRMLIRAGLTPLDILSAYDRGEDGSLDQIEYVKMMKKLIGDDDIWEETEVKDVALDVFDSVSGGDGDMDLEEFERWMLNGWIEMKKALIHDRQMKRWEKDAEKGEASAAAAGSKGGRSMTVEEEIAARLSEEKRMGTPHKPLPRSASPALPRSASQKSIDGNSTVEFALDGSPMPGPFAKAQGATLPARQKAINDAIRLRAKATAAQLAAKQAQERATRLKQVALFAEAEAEEAELTKMQVIASTDKSNKGQFARRKLMAVREWREANYPALALTVNNNSPRSASASQLRPLSAPGLSRSGTVADVVELAQAASDAQQQQQQQQRRRPQARSPASKGSRPSTAHPAPVMGGPMVGCGKNAVPYWR